MKKPTKVKAVPAKREPVFTITKTPRNNLAFQGGRYCIQVKDSYHINLKGGNHEITWTTETRTTKQSVTRAIAWLRKFAAGAKVVDLTKGVK